MFAKLADAARFQEHNMEILSPTPHPDVNEILIRLHSRAKEVLQEDFVGMYLYGSLSGGDFNPQSSDIDFLVVTPDTLADEKIAALNAMHEQIWASTLKWASKLEGSYVPKDLIRRHDPEGPPCPTINEGHFYVARLGSDWIIQRHVVRECGLILKGPEPKTLIDPVTPDDIRSAVRGVFRERWFPMLEDPSWLKEHGSSYHGYAVISMCRTMHALTHGTIVSKPVAVAWAKGNLGPRWQPLIEQAVATQYGIDSEILEATLQFIRFTRRWISKKEKEIHEP